ncbi:and other transporter-domain-containing protein [Syncephalastrum racemosum]|uniref:And other transporter-domain-containing protein n=1 Tax=Syncephalastrum racemosum TaxID=13706 RepID=A0A1X2H8U5_SYNRA|nr:and other transporter-domain-containing protein [Syncephalastrum racemosum]
MKAQQEEKDLEDTKGLHIDALFLYLVRVNQFASDRLDLFDPTRSSCLNKYCRYEFSVLTGVVTMPNFQTEIATSKDSSSLVSTLMAGAFFGALASGPLADIAGRRGLMALGTLIFGLGGILQTGASAISHVYAGRAVTGVSIGFLSMVVPLYQSEIAPKNYRGRLISIQQFSITLGICVANWINFGTMTIANSSSWRLPLGLPLIPAFVYLIGTLFLPQSPRYLIFKHKDKEALQVLSQIRGDGTIYHPDVLMEFAEIKQSISFEQSLDSRRYWRLFQRGTENNRKRLLLGMAVQIFQQLTGANALFLYAPQIFQAAGIKGRYTSLFANGISGLVNLVFTVPPILFIDRIGRRPTLIAGSIVCCICVILMTILSALTGLTSAIGDNSSETAPVQMHPLSTLSNIDEGEATIAFIVMMYLFIASYACSWGPIGWIYPAELYSQEVRAQALGITTAANWLFNYGVTELTPLMYANIEWRAFLVYSIFCAVIPCIVYRYFPETMGKSLEEVDLVFSLNFNYYDVNVHHPQTAMAAIHQVEQIHHLHSRHAYAGRVEDLFGENNGSSLRTRSAQNGGP